MAYKKKQFSPHIYAEWGELFDAVTERERSEILLAITKFPEYEPKDVTIWGFIKSQVQKDYEIFIDKCEINSSLIKNYWAKKKQKNTEVNERLTDDNECKPKRITNNDITNNELQITEKKFIKPTVQDIKEYCMQRKNNVDAQRFFDYYDASDWKDKDGKKIKNWKQKIIAVWEPKCKNEIKKQSSGLF